jgi:hypothetical protein
MIEKDSMRRVFPLVAIVTLAFVSGCGPSAEARAKLLATRSAFFSELVSNTERGGLREGFENRFLDLDFTTSIAGPTHKTNDGRAVIETEITLTALNPPGNFPAIRPKILEQLEAHLSRALSATGMEREGEIHEIGSGGKKAGFWFRYRSKTHTGVARVDNIDLVPGVTLIMIREDE